MSKDFVKGMNLKTKTGKYGKFITGGIHKDIFQKNGINGEWLNFTIFTNKDGNFYPVLNKFDPENKVKIDYKEQEQTDNDGIPF